MAETISIINILLTWQIDYSRENETNKIIVIILITEYFSYQVSAIEAKVEHEENEFDNMEVINEKQENNKNVGINEDANARYVN